MRSWVLKKVFPGIRGTITCSGASFAWFSPVVLEDVAIHEPAEAGGGEQLRPAVTIKKITGNRPLWKLLWNTNSPGDFTVDKPVLDVVVTETGSNLIKVLKPQGEQTQSQRDKLKQLILGIELDGAQVSVSGRRMPRGWETKPIDLRLRIDGGLLTLDPVTLFEHSRLTPGACHDFLRFVAPILADVTTVDGQFSLKLDAWKVPLAEPKQTSGAGLLNIESLEVGPSPLVSNIAKQLKLSPNIVVVKDCPVNFEMKNERIHHVNLTFYIEGIMVRTSGSVGLDETLDMTVEIPMPKHLLGDGPLAKALAQQTVVLPVGGTLSKPAIDTERLPSAIGQLVGGTVKSLEGEEVKKTENLIEGLIQRKPGDKVEADKLIGDIIGTAGELLEQRRKKREQGEPGLLDRLRKRLQNPKDGDK